MNTQSLQFKILSTILVIAFTAILLVLGISWLNYQKQYEQTVSQLVQDIQDDVSRSLHNKMEVGVTNAVGFASNAYVQESLENSDRSLAMKTLNGIGVTYKQNTSYKGVKIHLHTKEGRSFLRAWRPKDFGDDLTAFRPGMVQVMETQKPVSTYTTGKRQLMLTGISPVFNASGEYLGSVEFIQGVGSVSRAYKKRGMHYMMLMNQHALTKSKEANKNIAVGPYRVANDKWFAKETVAFGQQVNWQLFEKQNWQVVDGFLVTTLPIVNLNNETIGLHMIGTPTTRLEAATEQVINQIISEIALVSAIVLLMVLFIVFRLRSLVLKPVKEIEKVVSEVGLQGNFSARIQSMGSKDEIGKMADNINQLLSSIQSAINETSETVKNLQQGNFSHRIESKLTGDLDALKQAVNGSAATIEETMAVIGDVLKALKEGDFSHQINQPSDVSGDFAVAISNALETLESLNQAIQEINVSAQHIAKADFSNEIQVTLSGDLNQVKDNLNHAQSSLNEGFLSFSNSLNSLIEGDLTTRVRGDYQGQLQELQSIINQSIVNISNIFSDVKYKADISIQNVHQVASGNADLNQRTQTQAASLEETAASMEQITALIQNSLNGANSARELTQKATDDANQGSLVMAQAKQAMEGIHEASSKIADITSLIDGIAFQTNLLALNAAVEAARAGEHGRGFAVVAGEVRSLAQKSADAAKEINALISDTTEQIEKGSKLTNDASEMLQQMILGIGNINERVAEIAGAAQEQTTGIFQINQTIATLDSNTQQNAAMVEQVTATTEEMSREVGELVDLTQKFKLDATAIEMKSK